MSYFTEFIIHELYDLININHLLNTTMRFKEYKDKYFYWKLNPETSFTYYRYIDSQIQSDNIISSILLNSNNRVSLNLRYCKNITDEGIRHLGKVHTLDLRCCDNITDEGIKHLGNVHTLDLSGCKNITDECIKHLGNSTRFAYFKACKFWFY